ncbi:MAG: S1C family serine protease [Alphaproteobacteria bacterium]|nr:S1C family serine protease [Alphaproteobacteria bacterium]
MTEATDSQEWLFPASLQPKPSDLGYDLDAALGAMMELRAEIPKSAFTAGILGTQRAGNAVLISDSGLVVTIGYLICEAETIWLITRDGAAIPGHPLLYDFNSGFGLVQALARPDVPHLTIGSSAALSVSDRVVVAGHGGRGHALRAQIVGKREFAGYWEYVLDEAIFTAPMHPNWGGAALLDPEGQLGGIGSLYVQDARGGNENAEGNMMVPIDLLPPLLERLQSGRGPEQPERPWLGYYVSEVEGKLVVLGVAEQAPAHLAGVEPGDVVLEVGGAPIGDLADLFRTMWALGPAGVEVPLTLLRDGEPRRLTVRSATRDDFLRTPRLH